MRWVLPLVLLLSVACDNPAAPRLAPRVPEMIVMLALDPDSSVQPLVVTTAEVGGRLAGLRADVYRGNVVVASAQAATPAPEGELSPCAARYLVFLQSAEIRCLALDFTPEFGTTYRLVVSADGRPQASAVATVPGDFDLLEVEADGEPPGTGRLLASWTESDGRYRYVVGLRSEEICNQIGCESRPAWHAVTEATEISTTVPEDEIEGGLGPWHLDVYAVDQALYQFLTTGTGGDLFSVPFIHNIEGGYGIFGAWVRRSRPLR